MNLVIVELIGFSGYFSFKKIPFKLSFSSANRSAEDDRQWARFNMVIIEGILCNRHQHGFDSREVGLYLLFSCRRMFSAATKKKAICFQWQINYGFEFGGLENILTFDIFCC